VPIIKGATIKIFIIILLTHSSNMLSMLQASRSRFTSVVIELANDKLIRYKECNVSQKPFPSTHTNPIPIDIDNITIWLKTSVKRFSMERNLIKMLSYTEKDYFVTHNGRIIEGEICKEALE